MCQALVEMTAKLGIGLIYKTSFDKANRTAIDGARGMGMEKGLPILAELRERFGVPVLTDVHTAEQCAPGGRGGGRAADPGLPLPADRSAASPPPRPGGRSTSRRGSSSPPGT